MADAVRANGGRPTVLVVGPGPRQVGGLATFLSILLGSELVRSKYRLIHVDTTRGAAGAGKASDLAFVNVIYLVRDMLRFMWLSLRYRPHILHVPVNSFWAFWKDTAFILLGRLFGMKVVAHLHGGYFEYYYDTRPRAGQRIIGWVLKRAHVVIALSNRWKGVLLRIRPDLRVEVVPNTVDFTFAGAVDRAADDGPGRDPQAVLFLGALARHKGVFDIIQAIPRVRERRPETQFLFAGTAATAAEQAEIDAACRAAGATDGVRFLGYVGGQDKLDLFLRSSIYLLPSHVENLPYSLLEAMSAGLPVIATPVGAIPELVQNGVNGFIVGQEDPAALADRIVMLLDDADLRASMSRANLALIRAEYMPEVAMRKFISLYDRLVPSYAERDSAPSGRPAA